jgi:hypothetical protein
MTQTTSTLQHHVQSHLVDQDVVSRLIALYIRIERRRREQALTSTSSTGEETVKAVRTSGKAA